MITFNCEKYFYMGKFYKFLIFFNRLKVYPLKSYFLWYKIIDKKYFIKYIKI